MVYMASEMILAEPRAVKGRQRIKLADVVLMHIHHSGADKM